MPESKKGFRPLALLRSKPRLVAAGFVGFAALGAFAAGIAMGAWQKICRDCPSIAQIYVWEPMQSTKLLTHDGLPLAELFEERRTWVGLDELPRHVPLAFLSIEDRRFYQHDGFDLRGIGRAVLNQIRGLPGGGSTITQQLARHMFQEEVGFDVQFRRKLRELRVALELEQVYTKEQILEAYLNQINYGPGWFGIETAAQRFFGKRAAELDVAEAALLAAVINRPGAYSPFRHPDRALARRNLVLGMMADQGHLERDDAQRWMQQPLPEQPHSAYEGGLAPDFVEWVREMLYDRYGRDIYRRGFRVYTSLDIEMQRGAQQAMDSGWARIEGQPGYRHPKYADVAARGGTDGATRTPYLQGAFVAYDTETGHVRALVGSRDFGDSKFNRAVQARRQPGSVFKPFVYAAAIAGGLPPSHVIDDAPIMLTQADGSEWAPRNYGGEFQGPMTLRDALRISVNVVAVKLGLDVGIETVAQYARRFGIRTEIPRYPSTFIGAAEVIPIQVAEAYSPFATGGERVRPRAILRVEDVDGRVLFESRTERERVLDPLSAYVLADMLRDVVDAGTAAGAIRGRGNVPYDLPLAGKTGTTNDFTDVWFVGFNPEMVAAVWFGFDQRRRILPNATGGVYAAPVFAEFMRSVYAGPNPLRPLPPPWNRPAELTTRQIDRQTGMVATDWCPTQLVYTEIFVPGTEPTEACDHAGGLFRRPLRRAAPLPPPDTLAEPPGDTTAGPLPDTT